jgi:hypothetical protein
MPEDLWKKATLAKMEGKIKSLNQGCLDGLYKLLTCVQVPKRTAQDILDALATLKGMKALEGAKEFQGNLDSLLKRMYKLME